MTHPDDTRVRRLPERQVHEREVLDAILDAAYVGHVATVEGDQPYVLPMAVARDGDSLLLHGSTGSRLMRGLGDGSPTCVTVTHLDGLVYSRSAFESSMNYRCAMVFGTASVVPGEEKVPALRVLTEHLFPGRWDELRAPHRRELAATVVLRLPIERWSVKAADGYREDDPGDLDAPVWAGVVPLVLTAREPVDAPDLAAGLMAPAHVLDRRG